jgi:iron(III) transport system ATP-binding protein
MPERAGGALTQIPAAPRGRSPATIAARLTYENVTHRYGHAVAVRDFSLDIAPGEIVCLLGHSGCGKTTLLRLAAGVEEPGEGRILLNGQEASGPSRFLPPEKRHVGLMFQDFALFPHLTNLQNVMFGLKALPRAEAEREARAALARLGLEHYADAYPHMLSGGEQQRVALARAVVPRPSVLLMDEPFSGLDSRLRDDVRDETLHVLRESRVTTVIVTHDPEEALRMGDRVAVMHAGRLVQVDTPEGVYRRAADLFVARFFCELNEIAGMVRGGQAETPLGRFAAPGFPDNTAVVVAIRPQALRLRQPGSSYGVPGSVRRRQFLGPVDLVEVVVAGLDAPLKGRVPRDAPGAVNAEIAVDFDTAEVLVFAASGA